jgi:hypothetical protein
MLLSRHCCRPLAMHDEVDHQVANLGEWNHSVGRKVPLVAVRDRCDAGSSPTGISGGRVQASGVGQGFDSLGRLST